MRKTGLGTLLGNSERTSLGNKWKLGSMGFEAIHASLQGQNIGLQCGNPFIKL